MLGWSRAQQAAFLIYVWRTFRNAVAESKDNWANNLRNPPRANTELPFVEVASSRSDMAFYGGYSLICTDQGVRGFLQVINDLCYQRASHLKLNTWLPDSKSSVNPIEAVDGAMKSIEEQGFTDFLKSLVGALANFDWRTSSTPEIEDALRRAKLVFRGSGGYKELRTQLLEHLAKGDGEVARAAKQLVAA